MAEKLKCGICGQRRLEEQCHIIVLTHEEKAALLANNTTPPKECVYCKPCWNILKDPITGPTLMKGLFQIQLREIGVPQAEGRARRYHAALLEKMKKTV